MYRGKSIVELREELDSKQTTPEELFEKANKLAHYFFTLKGKFSGQIDISNVYKKDEDEYENFILNEDRVEFSFFMLFFISLFLILLSSFTSFISILFFIFLFEFSILLFFSNSSSLNLCSVFS